ncbi:MAG: hypothetical protein AAF790_11405 [Planctomycetota bacterium]
MGVTPADAAHTPISSSVLLLDAQRYQSAGEYLERAASHGGGRVQVVVTLHARFTPDLRVLEYGLLLDRRRSWQDASNFRPMSADLCAWLEARLTDLFAAAARRGLSIAVLPHLDAAGPVQEWRNRYDFAPDALHKGFSYTTALIEPTLRALNAAGGDQQTWFAVCGEMGRSVFKHPDAYHRLLSRVRRDRPATNMAVGLSLNFREIDGGQALTTKSRRKLQHLLDACDFLGFSNYRPFAPPPTPKLFADATAGFLDELRTRGLSPPRVPLHFSELGLGGGDAPAGKETPLAAAQKPWAGVGAGRRNPWTPAAMIELRRAYYGALIEFLAGNPSHGPDHNLPQRPAAVFLWSESSWEPLGVDTVRFADPEITHAIRRHNQNLSEPMSDPPGPFVEEPQARP